MLVLTRKNQESVIVGGAGAGDPMLKVTVLEVRGGKVRLGIEGDRNIRVLRSELLERDLAPKAHALQFPVDAFKKCGGPSAQFQL
jgi:carbon storage regulator CsrA